MTLTTELHKKSDGKAKEMFKVILSQNKQEKKILEIGVSQSVINVIDKRLR